jgi:hypothetical protein
MSKRFRECSLDQPFLLPPSLQDWLPENHLARFVADVVHQLDLREIYDCYKRKAWYRCARISAQPALMLGELPHPFEGVLAIGGD